MNKPSKPAPRIAEGDIVHCVFLDHSQGGDDIMRFEVFGRVKTITPRHYNIYCWRYVDEVDRAADRNTHHNEENFCIVKKAVESIKRLK